MPEKTVNAQGQQIGRKGTATREKLLSALEELLDSVQLSELTVITVAEKAQVSPATFYVYFPALEDAVDQLMQRVVDEVSLRCAQTAEKHWKEGTEHLLPSELSWILADEVGSNWSVMAASASLWLQGSAVFAGLFDKLLEEPMMLIPTADPDCENTLKLSLRSLVLEVVLLRDANLRRRNDRIRTLVTLVELAADHGTKESGR